MKRKFNNYFIRQLWVAILLLLPVLKSQAQQPTYIKNIKYTDVIFAVYFAHCDYSQMQYTINGTPISPTVLFASSGFIANRIPFGLLHVGDTFTVTNTCDGTSVSKIIQDDYAYVEIPNGSSYTGNGISPSDTDPPYSRLQTPIQLGKCEVIKNVNAHILDNYYFSMNDPITYGVFKHNGYPIVAGDYSEDHYGQTGVNWHVNPDGSVYTDNATTLTSYQGYSGANTQSISYTHNGATINSDLTLNFGGLSIRYIQNGSYSIEKNTYNGLQKTDFTGDFSNSTFEIRYTSAAIEAWVDGVKKDELQRDVQYSVSGGGTLSNTGGLTYGTPVDFTPTTSGDYVITAVINGVRRAEQKIHIASDPTVNSVTNANCPNDKGQIVANSTGAGFYPLQYAITGGTWGSINTFSGLNPGNYTIGVKDASGCEFYNSVTVSVNNSSPSISVSGTNCAADLKTYSVSFTSNGSVVSSLGTVSGNIISGIPVGTNVDLTATSSVGCQTSLSVIAPNCACPTVNAPSSAGNKSFCAGSVIPSISVNVGTDETVDWYDSPAGGKLVASSTMSYQATQAGTYYAETRNTVHGCKSATRTAVTVSQNTLPSLSVLGTACSADLKTYSVNFTSNGSVVSSLGTVAGNIISGIPAGTNVNLTATSVAGCQTSLSVTAPNCACPTVNAPSSAGDKSFCTGSVIPSISVSVGSNETVDWFDAPTGGNLLAASTTSYQATQAGTYYAETRNTVHGCKSTTRTAMTVSQNTLPILSVSGTNCSADLKTYSVNFTSNGSVVSSLGTVAGNIISGIPAGTNVNLTATSVAGCQTSLSVTAPNCACPTVNAPSSAGDKAFCAGSVMPSISVNVGTNETVDWFDAPTGGNVLASSTTSYQPTQAGTYYAETRNTVHGCKSATRTAVTVSQNALPSLLVSGTSCAADLKTYSVNITSNGSVSSSSGTVAGNSIINIPAGTNVSLTATSAAGCQTSLSVTAPNCACPTVNAPSSAGDKAFCAGSVIPSVSVSVGSNETVDWFDAPTGGNVLASSTTLYQATQAGTYYAETRNTVHGCKSAIRTAVTVSQNALPSLSLSGTNCAADLKTYLLSFTSNGSVVSSSGTVAGNIISGIPAGTNVNLTATSVAGCQTSLSVTAPNCVCPTVNAPSSAGDKSFCAGSAIPSILVNVGSNETVDWFDASTGGNVLASSTTSYQATQAGTYYAETRNTVHGCKSAIRTAITVSQNALPSLSVSGTVCSADLKTYSVNFTSNGSVSSSSGTVSGNSIINIPAGMNVSLTATSVAGCQTTLDVTAPNCSCPYVPAPVSSGNIISSCAGSAIPPISVSVSSDETVDWYDSPTGGKILASSTTSYQATQAGTYYAETRNTVHGCKSATRTAVTLQINNLPSVALVATSCALNIKTYSIDFTTNGSVSTTSGLLSGNTITGIPAGTNVTLTATSPEGCQSSLVVDAPICSPCILRVKADDTTITQGQRTTLHATGCAGTFVWQNTGKEGTDITVNPIATTTYTGACWFDAGEPQCTAEITITVNPCQLSATATKQTITQGESTVLTASGCENGTLAWVDSKSELATITVKPLVTTTYTAKCWYAEGVESCSVSKTITVNPCQLTATATKETINQGENVTLTASGCENGTLAWVDSKSELATITVKPLVTTTYTAKCWYTDGTESCSVSKTITVNSCQLSASATKETINQGESTVLTASGCENGTLAWVDSKSELATITVKPLITTTYTAKCWYAEGVESCSVSRTITVNPCQLTATATKETITQGESVTLMASGCENGYLAWVDSKSELATIMVKPFVTTTYTAKCWYAEGVESCSVSKTITVNPCQLSATANADELVLGGSLQIKSTGCIGTLIYPQDTTQNGNSVFTYIPMTSQGFTVQCMVENTISCDTTINIVVAPCHLQARAKKAVLTSGESLTIVSTGCVGTLIYPQDTTQNGSSVFTYAPTKSQGFTVQCKVGEIISCDTSINIVVAPCHLQGRAEKATLTGGELLKITSSGCVGTLIYPNDTTQNGKSVFTYLPTKSQSFTIQCKVGEIISCDTTMNIVVDKCPSIIQATATTIVKGDYTTLSYQGCPNTVVWRGLGQGMSKNVSPSKTMTYHASCNYGDKLQYSCSTDSIVIKVRPKQPILDNTRLGVSGIALQDTICLNNPLVLGVNCDVDAKAYWNDKRLNELKVDASQAGIQTYRFYCQNADGKSDESLAEILVKGFEVEDAIIYPVPTAGLLHIKSKGCLDNLRLTLYSLSGQVLYQGNGESRTNDSISIDLTFLPSNEYVLHISGMQGNQPMTKRVRIVKYSK